MNDNGVFRMFSEHFHITFSEYFHFVIRIIGHLPDDKKKSTKTEEEDKGNYGSNQHQCAQFLCLLYYLPRMMLILILKDEANVDEDDAD